MRTSFIFLVFVAAAAIAATAHAQQTTPKWPSADPADSSAQAVLGGQGDVQIRDVKTLPIEGIDRVTLADGRVYYISKNRHFIFLGEMVDTWTGESVDGMNRFDRLDWQRAGLERADVALPPVGEGPPYVLFITPDCASCRAALEAGLAAAKAGEIALWVAPMAREKRNQGWPEALWCDIQSGADVADRLTTVVQNTTAETKETANMPRDCRPKAPRMAFSMALAYRFPAMPALVGPDGTLSAGAGIADHLATMNSPEEGS